VQYWSASVQNFSLNFMETLRDSIMIIKWLMLHVILIVLILTSTSNVQIHRIKKNEVFFFFQIFKSVVNAVIFVL